MLHIRTFVGRRVGMSYGPITSSIDDKKPRRRTNNTPAPPVIHVKSKDSSISFQRSKGKLY